MSDRRENNSKLVRVLNHTLDFIPFTGVGTLMYRTGQQEKKSPHKTAGQIAYAGVVVNYQICAIAFTAYHIMDGLSII